MDPDANLKEQLELTNLMLEKDNIDSDQWYRLAELVEALNEWISNGGALPKGWKLKK